MTLGHTVQRIQEDEKYFSDSICHLSLNKMDALMNGSVIIMNSIPKSRARSISMASSTDVEKRMLEELIDSQSGSKKLLKTFKMIAVILLPIISLILVSAFALSEAVSVRSKTNIAKGTIFEFLNIARLVTNLQVERGTSATFLSSEGKNIDANARLSTTRTKTDNLVANVAWPSSKIMIINNQTMLTKESFTEYLNDFRYQVRDVNVSVEDNINFYTNITFFWMDHVETFIILPERGKLWEKLVAANVMLRASDAVGIQRALGSTFFTLCAYASKSESWFIRLDGQYISLLYSVFSYQNILHVKYRQRYVGTQLEKTILIQKSHMRSDTYEEKCLKFSEELRFENSFVWFQNLTQYIVLLKGIRDELTREILAELNFVLRETLREVVTYSVIMVFVSVGCVAVSLWYALKIFNLTHRMASSTKSMREKSCQLETEKKRADEIVYQLLPHSVADALKMHQEVKPEFFEAVTIYFSDIVGFTNISSRSTPMQVVDTLNNLYTLFDGIIDSYDVYKVETIGDAYMCVSGCPTPTQKHAFQIAHLSLDLVDAVDKAVIPHLPDERLKVRIGLHTGSAVAGVVGLKMPRYCLFGDNINIASRMESSGQAQRVQISDTTHRALLRDTGFIMEFRRENDIKAYGLMKTYWLNGFDNSAVSEKKTIYFDIPDN